MDMNSKAISNVLQNGAPVTQQVGAYNTYVGARYVPIFDGEWSATKQYEPLTVVINQGNSYTSAQYVPAGTPLQSDGPFWFLTGNFNGQISALNSKIDSINGTLTEEIDEINRKLGYSSKNILCVSDSYGTQPVSNNWISILASISNWQIQNLSKGSIGFNVKADGVNLQEFIQANLNIIPSPDSLTDVILALGANDCLATAQSGLQESIVNCINYCKTTFPNANIWIGFIGNTLHVDNNYTTNKINTLNAYKMATGMCMARWIDGAYPIMHNYQNVQTDLVHPNVAGATEIAKCVYSNLNGVKYTYFAQTKLTVKGQPFIVEKIIGETAVIELFDATLDNLTFTYGFNLLDTVDGIFYPYGDGSCAVNAMIDFRIEQGICQIFFNGSGIYVNTKDFTGSPIIYSAVQSIPVILI